MGQRAGPRWNIWTSINLASKPMTPFRVRLALKSAGFGIDDGAREILSSDAFAEESAPGSADLVVVTGRELGLARRFQCREMYARAREFGLEVCAAPMVPEIAKQIEPTNIGRLTIGMPPVRVDQGCQRLFVLIGEGQKRCLSSEEITDDDEWTSDRRVVFIRSCRPS